MEEWGVPSQTSQSGRVPLRGEEWTELLTLLSLNFQPRTPGQLHSAGESPPAARPWPWQVRTVDTELRCTVPAAQ